MENKSQNEVFLILNNIRKHKDFEAFMKWMVRSSQLDEINSPGVVEAKQLKLGEVVCSCAGFYHTYK